MLASLAVYLFANGVAAPYAGIGSTDEFSMCAKGNFVAAALTPPGAKCRQVVLRDLTRRTNTTISLAKGQFANKAVADINVSASGDAVAFTSCATNLGADDSEGYNHLFVWDSRSKMLRVASNGLPKAYGNSSFFHPALSNEGTMVMFQSRDKKIPTRLWISEGGKQPVTLAAKLKLGEPIKEDVCGTISSDGSRFFAIVKDPVYNDGKPLENPILISGSFDSLQITRTELPKFGPSNTHAVSNLKISANGNVLAFGQVQKDGAKWETSYYLVDLTEPNLELRQVITRPEGHSYYASAFALSGNGNVIVYQSNPRREAHFGDQLYAYNWRLSKTEIVSVSSGGVKVKDRSTVGYNGVNLNAISSDWDCSKVVFISADPLGAYTNSHLGTTSEILVRDMVTKRTTLLQ